MDKSENKTQVLFKHSPSCAVSYFAKRSLNSEEILNNDKFDFQTVDVINERSLSRKIAELLEVRHESPQIIVIKNRKVIWHDSHNGVNADNLLNHINFDQNVT